jgi:prepilin-type N-terminal cleavage/methylation domain-containing protein
MKQRAGFTLIELLVVIVIIVMLTGITIAMSGAFLRGQGVRQGSGLVIQTVARAKQLTADQRVMHFLVFTNLADGGRLEVRRDANSNGTYEVATDLIDGQPVDMPKYCMFEKAPSWMGFNPSGYVVYSTNGITVNGAAGAFVEVQAGEFDGNTAAATPAVKGDIVLKMLNESYRVLMDVDRTAGKVRRHQFVAP